MALMAVKREFNNNVKLPVAPSILLCSLRTNRVSVMESTSISPVMLAIFKQSFSPGRLCCRKLIKSRIKCWTGDPGACNWQGLVGGVYRMYSSNNRKQSTLNNIIKLFSGINKNKYRIQMCFLYNNNNLQMHVFSLH